MSDSGRVTVTQERDGLVRIGPHPVAASTVQEVALTGVTVVIDPSDPDPAGHALVYDVDLALPVVERLFGEPVRDALSARGPSEVDLDPSPELAEIEHLGRLQWLRSNRSFPLDPSLLDLEIAAAIAQWSDQDVFLETPGLIEVVTRMSAHLREHPDAPLGRPLRRLLREVMGHLPAGDAEFVDVDHERDLLRIEDEWGSAGLDAADLAWLARQFMPQAAFHLGAGRELVGQASLDWRRVPSALLPAAEDAVWFTVVDGRVSVVVPGPPAVRPHPAVARGAGAVPALIASLRSSTWPLPLAEGSLSRDPSGNEWRGQFDISDEAEDLARNAPVLDVDVRSAALDWAPLNVGEARRAAARRWASRGIQARRLASVAQDAGLAAAGVDSLRYAARLWSSVGSAEPAKRCLDLATEPLPAVRLGLAERWFLSGRAGVGR